LLAAPSIEGSSTSAGNRPRDAHALMTELKKMGRAAIARELKRVRGPG
jgi:hypothetical protein